MLTKLLKYEIKDTARFIPFFYLIAVLFAVMALIAKQIGIDWFKVTSSIVLILVGISIVIITFVIIVIRFYKNLYTNEGYLMFTLPVKPQKLLASKTIVAFSWIIISFIVSIGSVCVSLFCLGVDYSEFEKIINELEKYGLDKVIYLIIPLMCLSIIYLLSQIFFAITVANISAFHKIGGGAAFLVFLATYVGLQIVQTVASIFVPLSIQLNITDKISASLSTKNMLGFMLESIKGVEPTNLIIGLGGYVFVIIMVCVLFYLTGRMMNKKVSLR